ncbi:MAG: histidine--tRNA ligase [Candidatus Eremiobacteraeota bacterium]|nr:histidine--tRNA ligase [Candidatus Eremiobacteraeota bacterium]
MKHAAAPRGTFDVLPSQAGRWQALERTVDDVCGRFGYREIRTPIFESTEVFVRTIGAGTDIVDKEMYTFSDRAGRSITLRPELTAPVVRAVLEHNLLAELPLKLYYRGPIFRYERPQKGRYRQSHQWGVELFGVAGPEADAEVIALGMELVSAVGVTDHRLEINSMGCEWCRTEFRGALVAYLTNRAQELSATSRERLERNPLRILDSKDEGDRAILAHAPTIDSFWCETCRAHLAAVRELLDAMGIPSELNTRIVRGFDYYTRTVFEITSQALGAQNAICGGGRYDNLVKDMGGPPTPGVGLAMGMERLLLLVEAAQSTKLDGAARVDVAMVALEPEDMRALVPVMHALRRRGIGADMDYTRRKLEKQIKSAAESGARLAVIVGGDERVAGEATVQDLRTRERIRVKLADLGDAIADVLRENERSGAKTDGSVADGSQ